jgi:hypothetical protein
VRPSTVLFASVNQRLGGLWEAGMLSDDERLVTCTNGHRVDSGHRFCPECGTPLTETGQETLNGEPTVAPSQPVEQLPLTTPDRAKTAAPRICPNGHAAESEDEFCAECGRPVVADADPASYGPPVAEPAWQAPQDGASAGAATQPPATWLASDGRWYPSDPGVLHAVGNTPIESPHSKRNTKVLGIAAAVVVVVAVIAAIALSTGKKGNTVDATTAVAPESTSTVDPQAQCRTTMDDWIVWITGHGGSGGFASTSDVQTNVSSFTSVVGYQSPYYQPVVQIVYRFEANEMQNGNASASAAAAQAEAAACTSTGLASAPFPSPPSS